MRDEGPEQPAPADSALIDLLRMRDGTVTAVHLATGDAFTVWNVAWGYDIGDAWAHVTSSVSPLVDGFAIDLFDTADVVRISDPADGLTLWQAVGRSDYH
jgi:hypothetical protein